MPNCTNQLANPVFLRYNYEPNALSLITAELNLYVWNGHISLGSGWHHFRGEENCPLNPYCITFSYYTKLQ